MHGLESTLAIGLDHVQYIQAKPQAELRFGSRLLWLQRPTLHFNQTCFPGWSTLVDLRRGPANLLLQELEDISPEGRRAVQQLAGSADQCLTALICTAYQPLPTPLFIPDLQALGLRIPAGIRALRRPLRIAEDQFERLVGFTTA